MGESFLPGTETWYASDSPTCNFSAFFEDDGSSGYFYAYDSTAREAPIIDALHIYNVAAVVDRNVPSIVEIIWSEDGLRAALLLNEYPHAVIDFRERCSYCRSGFPPPPNDWRRGEWHEDLMELFHNDSN